MVEAEFEHTAFSSIPGILFPQSWSSILIIGDIQAHNGRLYSVNFIEAIKAFSGGKIDELQILV